MGNIRFTVQLGVANRFLSDLQGLKLSACKVKDWNEINTYKVVRASINGKDVNP